MSNRTDRDPVLDQIVQRQQEKDLERAEEEDGRQDVPERGPLLARGSVVALLSLIFASVLVWNVWVMRAAPPVPTVLEAETSTRMLMAVASLQIESFRQTSGRLPTTLAEANAPTAGLAYFSQGTTYRLEAVAGDEGLIHEDGSAPETIIEGISGLAQEPGR